MHVRRQETRDYTVVLSDPDAIAAEAEAEYARQSREFRSWRTRAFRQHYVAWFVVAYLEHVRKYAKPPGQRRCAVCGEVGAEVHEYVPDRGYPLRTQFECDDLYACHRRLFDQRHQRLRKYPGVLAPDFRTLPQIQARFGR